MSYVSAALNLLEGKQVHVKPVYGKDGKITGWNVVDAGLKEIFGHDSEWNIPPEPGTTPIPKGHVRLYHQTGEHLLGAIKHQGLRLDKGRGIEGPNAIYADEHGFYGEPSDKPTVEFHVPKEQWDRPFVTNPGGAEAGATCHSNWRAERSRMHTLAWWVVSLSRK
jgi:hypothetical protein